MLPFENMVADYIKETDNHVLYRVTPVFENQELVAGGFKWRPGLLRTKGTASVIMSMFIITSPALPLTMPPGKSEEMGEESSQQGESSQATEGDYILNTSSRKFHLPDCPSVDKIKEQNKEEYHGSREDLMEQGYEPCQSCHP